MKKEEGKEEVKEKEKNREKEKKTLASGDGIPEGGTWGCSIGSANPLPIGLFFSVATAPAKYPAFFLDFEG